MRSNAATKPIEANGFDLAEILTREIDEATRALDACLGELEKVLARPEFDAGALTSVRLKLAGIRLTRGPLIMRVSEFLADKVAEAECAALDELRASHHRILQAATAHTGKWTLEAISQDWSTYRRETRQLVNRWRAKAELDHQLIRPLLRNARSSH